MTANHYPQFLLIGDSIIQYTSFTKDGFSFGADLSEHVQRRLDVINRLVPNLQFSDQNTANLIEQRLEWL